MQMWEIVTEEIGGEKEEEGPMMIVTDGRVITGAIQTKPGQN